MVAIQDMEKWVEDAFRRPLAFFGYPMMRFSEAEEIIPTVDILESNGEIVVKAELPGVKKEDIDVTLTDDTITISGFFLPYFQSAIGSSIGQGKNKNEGWCS